MSNKKFNLKEKLQDMAFKNNGHDDISREMFPPIIGEDTQEYSVVKVPPKFNKEKFENLKFTEKQVKQVSYVEAQREKLELNDQGIIKRTIAESNSEVINLKKVRKTELEAFLDSKKSMNDLECKSSEVKSTLDFEKNKNHDVRLKLSNVKSEINDLSASVEKCKRESINIGIENDSISNEIDRMTKTRDQLDETLVEISKSAAEVSALLSSAHRDKNDLINLMSANKELIEDFKKKIILNKENISSIKSDIEFKNKQIIDQSSENQLLKEEIDSLCTSRDNCSRELSSLELESESEVKKLDELKDKSFNLRENISLLEKNISSLSEKKKKITASFHEYESLCISLEESKTDLQTELDSKNEIISNYDSKITYLQQKSNQLTSKNSTLKETTVNRKREVEKLQKIFEVRKTKIQRVENVNYELDRDIELLNAELEEIKVHNSALDRRLSSLNFDTKNYQLDVSNSRVKLEDLKNENSNLERLIISSNEQRDMSVEKISGLRIEIHRNSSEIEQRNDELLKAESDYLRQASSLSGLKSKRDESSTRLSEIENSLSTKTYEIKTLLVEKRENSLRISDLNEEVILLKNKMTLKSSMLKELKNKKINLLDEKLAVEEFVNRATSEVTSLDSDLYSEKEIVLNIERELREVNERIEDMTGFKTSLIDDLNSLKQKREDIIIETDKLVASMRQLDSEALSIERNKSELDSDILRLSEKSTLLEREFTISDAKTKSNRKVVSDLAIQKNKFIEQISVRTSLIEKKRDEFKRLSSEEQELNHEVDRLSRGFKSSNSRIITSTMDVKNLREQIKRKKLGLDSVKKKYGVLSRNSKELTEDFSQQMTMIKELNETKNKYMGLIEELSVKNSNKFSSINENNKIIENLKDEVENLKENVHLLKNYRKKKAA